jgi:hypothetical protein
MQTLMPRMIDLNIQKKALLEDRWLCRGELRSENGSSATLVTAAASTPVSPKTTPTSRLAMEAAVSHPIDTFSDPACMQG